MPSRKQKKKVKKLADVLKKCSISSLSDNNTAPVQPEKPSSDTLLPNIENETKDLDIKTDSDVPTIFLHQPVDFKEHVHELLQSGVKFYQPLDGVVYTKINCPTFEDHKLFTQYLECKKLLYHTYGNPENRILKVVIRGLPKDTCLNAVKDELTSINVHVLKLHKMQTKPYLEELLVLAIVSNDDEFKKLMNVEKLLDKEVKIERAINKPRQCHRCQKWGHSQRYCYGQIRCLKCAGEHLTSECERDPTSEPPKCANCGGPHTANYKKCSYCPESTAYKSTQMRKWKHAMRHTKPKLVTLLNYEDQLYKNKISLAESQAKASRPKFYKYFAPRCQRDPTSEPPKCANCKRPYVGSYKRCIPKRPKLSKSAKIRKWKRAKRLLKAKSVTQLNRKDQLKKNEISTAHSKTNSSGPLNSKYKLKKNKISTAQSKTNSTGPLNSKDQLKKDEISTAQSKTNCTGPLNSKDQLKKDEISTAQSKTNSTGPLNSKDQLKKDEISTAQSKTNSTGPLNSKDQLKKDEISTAQLKTNSSGPEFDK